MKKVRLCSVENCGSVHYAKSFCKKHWHREYRKTHDRTLYKSYRKVYISGTTKACWKSMVSRCTNPINNGYHAYGDHGISVSEEWLDYDNFVKDMGERPSSLHTIDRIDNNLGYYKENCRWATRTMQAINRRIFKNNTSGKTGVHWDKNANKWKAIVKVQGKALRLGSFANKDDAIAARLLAEEKYYKPLLSVN